MLVGCQGCRKLKIGGGGYTNQMMIENLKAIIWGGVTIEYCIVNSNTSVGAYAPPGPPIPAPWKSKHDAIFLVDQRRYLPSSLAPAVHIWCFQRVAYWALSFTFVCHIKAVRPSSLKINQVDWIMEFQILHALSENFIVIQPLCQMVKCCVKIKIDA